MGKFRRNKLKFPKKYCPIDFLKCDEYNFKGQCLVKWNNKIYNVDEMIVGEEAKILIYYEEEHYGDARAILLKEPSFKRALPLGHPKTKLGCYHLAHLKDQYQDEWKQNMLEKIFKMQVNPIIVGERKFYRNKVVLHNGGFFPPGQARKHIIIPTSEQFDLMKIDFTKYQETKGDIIIRQLDSEIIGSPGENKFTTHHFMGKIFQVNLNSFYQVNNEMTQKAYEAIKTFIFADAIVFDLFAGAATIGIHVSEIAKQVFAVEINKQSYLDGLNNIALNKIENISMINDDANTFLINSEIKPDIIIVDPARSGLSEKSMQAMNNSYAKRIIYLSCNIETQKRDIDFLTNYEIKHIQPYDFFPQTYHIENLIILDLKS